MAFGLSPKGFIQLADNNGNAASGWKLYTYFAGSTTPADTYTDDTGTTKNSNPIILDSFGAADVWLDQDIVYKFVYTNPNDVVFKTIDNITGTTGGISTSGNVFTTSGTQNYIPKFLGSYSIGDSSMYDDGTDVVTSARNFRVISTSADPRTVELLNQNFVMNGNSSFTIPKYSIEPGAPTSGDGALYFNTSTSAVNAYINSEWVKLISFNDMTSANSVYTTVNTNSADWSDHNDLQEAYDIGNGEIALTSGKPVNILANTSGSDLDSLLRISNTSGDERYSIQEKSVRHNVDDSYYYRDLGADATETRETLSRNGRYRYNFNNTIDPNAIVIERSLSDSQWGISTFKMTSAGDDMVSRARMYGNNGVAAIYLDTKPDTTDTHYYKFVGDKQITTREEIADGISGLPYKYTIFNEDQWNDSIMNLPNSTKLLENVNGTSSAYNKSVEFGPNYRTSLSFSTFGSIFETKHAGITREDKTITDTYSYHRLGLDSNSIAELNVTDLGGFKSSTVKVQSEGTSNQALLSAIKGVTSDCIVRTSGVESKMTASDLANVGAFTVLNKATMQTDVNITNETISFLKTGLSTSGHIYASRVVKDWSSTVVIDWSEGNYQEVDIEGNTGFTFSFGTAKYGGRYGLLLNNTSGYDISLPAAVEWAESTVADLSTSGKHFVEFYYSEDNILGDYYLASLYGGSNTSSGGGSTDFTKFPYIPQSTPPSPPAEGTTYYDENLHSLVIQTDNGSALEVGRESWIRVLNLTGSQIDNGTAVYISSGENSTGETFALAELANATQKNTCTFVGLATQNIPNGAYGEVTVQGYVRDIDTSAFSNGDIVYISTTDGQLTNIAPAFPNYECKVGRVLGSSTSAGLIFVDPDVDPPIGSGGTIAAGLNTYPIVLCSDVLAVDDASNQGTYISCRVIPTNNITVNNLSILVTQAGTLDVNGGIRFGIYTPGSSSDVLIAQTAEKTTNLSEGINTLPLLTPTALMANVPYMFAFQARGLNAARIGYRVGGLSPNPPTHFARFDGNNAPDVSTTMITNAGYSQSTNQIWMTAS
jgi:hypothetical protein